MVRTKRRLKIIGLALIIAGVLTGMLGPIFAEPKSSGMSHEERARARIANQQLALRQGEGMAALLGSGISLLLVGCLLRIPNELSENRIDNKITDPEPHARLGS